MTLRDLRIEPILYTYLGAFRKACGKRTEFVFIDAPHIVPAKDEQQHEQAAEKTEEKSEERGWWFSKEVLPHSSAVNLLLRRQKGKIVQYRADARVPVYSPRGRTVLSLQMP